MSNHWGGIKHIWQKLNHYNKRLDEILFCLTDQSGWDLIMYISFLAWGTTQEQHNELTAQLIVDRHEAKQALTSLTKEMVAEAMPEWAVISDNEMRIDRARKSAANYAVYEFEQNLLKALEQL